MLEVELVAGLKVLSALTFDAIIVLIDMPVFSVLLEVECVFSMRLPLELVAFASNAVVSKKEAVLLFDFSIDVSAMFASVGFFLVTTVVFLEVTEAISVMVAFMWFISVENIVVDEETATVSVSMVFKMLHMVF